MSLRTTLVALLLVACGPPSGPPFSAANVGEPARSTVDGEVLGVDHVAPADKLASGVQLRLGGEKPVVIDLAPDWYLDKQGLRFAPNERVHVEGREVERSGASILYAPRVTKGQTTVELRDADGNPLWIAPPLAPKK
jgi:hypothetical protein